MALGADAVYHNAMRRWLIRLLVVVVSLFGLMLVAGLVARSVISGPSQHGLAASLSYSLGVPVTVGASNFDLVQWFLLRPAIALEDIAIGNPPGFRSPHLLEAKKLSAQVSLVPLLHKIIEVHSIIIDQPRITAETNEQGTSNIETLLRKSKSRPGASSRSSETASGGNLVVDQFSVNSGEIAFVEPGSSHGVEHLSISDINISVRDFSRDQSCRLEFSAKLFGSARSRVRLGGQAGPFTSDSLPLSGMVTMALAPDEIPASLRHAEFGDLLAAPGKKAKVTLTATIRGDVYQRLSGPAKLVLTDVLIGKDAKHVLPLAGAAPVTFTATKLMSAPSFQLNIANALLRLGKGQWTGDAELQLRGSMTSGRSHGAVSNVDINELVSSATSADGKIYGVLEISSYSLQFAGKNAGEIRNSLQGTGKLAVAQGRLAALDLLSSIQEGIAHPQELLEGKKGATPFTTLAANMNIGQSKLNFDGIQLDSPALRVTGNGFIGFDQAINFELTAHTAGGIGQLATRVGMGSQAGGGGIPLTVTGTVESPRVRPRVGKIVTSVAGDLLDSFFKKKSK
ncbi:MAG: hypothetical protein DMG58_20560 [Acidobacteria bacterium]|nr:MAG: hypothetical protein DMG58_20560 [Acidobacteriota bacterium]